MNWRTKTFLVLLRLVIGWHFFFEGVSKLNSYKPESKPVIPAPHQNPFQYGWPAQRPVKPKPAGKAERPRKPWSSEAFLREATGPLAPLYRWVAGDPLLDRLEVLPAEDQGPNDKLADRLSPGLEKDWRAYFDAFVEHYHVQGHDLERLKAAFRQSKDLTVRWLLTGVKTVTRPAPAGNAALDVQEKTPQRIQEYKDRVKKLRDLEKIDPADEFRPDLAKELKAARADVNESRAELQAALDEQTREMKKNLMATLFLEPHRVRYGFLAALAFSPQAGFPDALTVLPASQVRQQYYFAKKTTPPDPVPEPVVRHWSDWDRLDWVDFLLRWGLAVIGFCLLAGLFTRTACVLGALFLLTVFLSRLTSSAIPINFYAGPEEETQYQLTFKTVIEMLALLALATTASGRWLGVDGLLYYLNPRNWRTRPAAPADRPHPERVHETAPDGAKHQPHSVQDPNTPLSPRTMPVSSMKEPTHGH
jgi:uncharacterized membrane protein YphA (DoxX/SURF4 family)